MNRADKGGNGQFLGPDLFFDDLFAMAAKKTFMSCESIIDTEDFLTHGSVHTLKFPEYSLTGSSKPRKELISLNALRTMGEMKTFKSSMLQQQRMKSYGSSSNQDFWISKITLNTLSL